MNKRAEVVTLLTVAVVALLLSMGTFTYFKSSGIVQFAPAGKCEFDKSVSDRLGDNGMTTRKATDYCTEVDNNANANEKMCAGKVSGKSGKVIADEGGIAVCKWTPNPGYSSGSADKNTGNCGCNQNSIDTVVKMAAPVAANMFGGGYMDAPFEEKVKYQEKNIPTTDVFKDTILRCNAYCKKFNSDAEKCKTNKVEDFVGDVITNLGGEVKRLDDQIKSLDNDIKGLEGKKDKASKDEKKTKESERSDKQKDLDGKRKMAVGLANGLKGEVPTGAGSLKPLIPKIKPLNACQLE